MAADATVHPWEKPAAIDAQGRSGRHSSRHSRTFFLFLSTFPTGSAGGHATVAQGKRGRRVSGGRGWQTGYPSFRDVFGAAWDLMDGRRPATLCGLTGVAAGT